MGDRWINVKSQEHSDFIQPEILHPLIVFIQSFFFFFSQTFPSNLKVKLKVKKKKKRKRERKLSISGATQDIISEIVKLLPFLLFLFRDLLELIEIVMN